MKADISAAPVWSAAAFGTPADTQPAELELLHAHIDRCREPLRLDTLLQHGARVTYGFVTARVATSVLVFVLLALLARSL